jgi:DNA-binding HxlR family transcriptional regulator
LLSISTPKGKGEIVARAGAQALSLLAVPFNAAAIRALAGEPQPLADIRRAGGSLPQTTMRAHLRSLAGAGVVERRRGDEFGGSVSYELTGAGRGLLGVAGYLAAWLARCPEGPIELGTTEAKSALKALVEGWSTGVVRALASRPLSLTELDKVIACLSYPSLERRLSSMRLLGMVEAMSGYGRSTPYAVSDWLRRAVAPLAAAARWEQGRWPERAPPITNRDVEAAFLLALPLLRLPADVAGSCRLAVEMGNGRRDSLVGVVAEAKGGTVVSSATRLQGAADSWVLGSAPAWFAAVSGQSVRGLNLGGEPRLATSMVEGLHAALGDGRIDTPPD